MSRADSTAQNTLPSVKSEPSPNQYASSRFRRRPSRTPPLAYGAAADLAFVSGANFQPSMSEGGSSMGASSCSASPVILGSQGNRLCLEDCPNCGCRLICIRSKQPDTMNQLFFKCPNNVKVSWVQFVASLCLNQPNL